MPSLRFFGTAASVAAAIFAALAACSTEGAQLTGDGPTDEGDAAAFARDGSVYDATTSPESGLGELRFQPEAAYTGFDGTHAFKVPIAVYDHGADVKVTAADPSSVDIVPAKLESPVNAAGVVDNGAYFMVTIKKAGTLALSVASGGRTATATITAASYDPARWAAGKARYESAGANGDPPCASCHVDGAAIDHSPAAMASVDDVKLGLAITSGISTAGFPIKSEPTKQHRWEVTAAEKDGLVTYLRGLEPRGFQ